MLDRLFRYISRKYAVKGFYGDVLIKFEDGVPTYHRVERGFRTQELPE